MVRVPLGGPEEPVRGTLKSKVYNFLTSKIQTRGTVYFTKILLRVTELEKVWEPLC